MNWEYLAGWFDADGSVRIVEKKILRKDKPSYHRKYVYIQFANSSLDVIQAIRDFLGLKRLKITSEEASCYPDRKSDYHRLQITKRVDCTRILQELEPRCIAKKKDIRDALEFLKSLLPKRTKKKPRKRGGDMLYV